MTGERMVQNHDSAIQANSGTLPGLISAALDWFGSGLQCCLPVKITAYDRSKRIATVMPLVKTLTREGLFKYQEEFSVQTFQYAANGFVIDFPIVIGDVGWVVASDRYTRNVKETHEICDLEDISTHRYSSGFFIPDYYGVLMDSERTSERNPYTGEDKRLVISTYDGKQKISIGGCASDTGEGGYGDLRIDSFSDNENKTQIVIKNGVVTMTTTNKVDVTANTSVNVKSPVITMAGVSGDSDVTITGPVAINGTLTVAGLITANGDVKNSDGTSFTTHTHPTAALGSPSSPTPGT